MSTVPRYVLCPKCRSLLQEPPPGNPFYQCGRCSTTLQVKHATPRDLEATSDDQRRRNSYSDSSSGEIGSDAVTDEYPLRGNRNDSPLDKTRTSATETIPVSGSLGRNVTKPQGVHPQDIVSGPYPQSLRNQEQNVKQRVLDVVSGAGYALGRAAQQEIGSRDHWSSSHDGSYETSVVQVQETEVRSCAEVTTTAAFERMSSVRQSYGTETLTSGSRMNGNLLAGKFQESQAPHVQCTDPDLALESVPDTGHNQTCDLGRLQIDKPVANRISQSETVVANIASGTSRKLQWKVRDSDSGDDATSSGAASSKGISEDEDGGSQDDVKSLSARIKQTTSVENKVERNRKNVHSRRHFISEDRRSLDEQQSAAAGQQQLLRARSDDSSRATDMYENSAHVLEYEPSDTSSTTMDEVDSNGGGGGSGRFSGEMDRQPPAVFDQGSSRPVPRPHLPRSTTNSSRGSVLSEESSSYGSPSHTEMVSLDNHRDLARITGAARRHSWDERTLSRMGAAASGYTGPQQGPSSVRVKSSSQDFGDGQRDYLHRMSSVSSDPGGRLPSNIGRQLAGSSSYDNYKQPSPYVLPSPQQQWVNRFVSPSASIQQQWSPNSSHRPYFPEPSPLHPLHSKLSSSLRQIPGGQLPPKQGQYPPLPPPGALQRVDCQHCELVLAVPDNLRPNLKTTQKTTQKLRCGSCRKISIFSVPQAEGSNAVQVFGSARSDSLQSPTLLASSPDSQAEFPSAYRTVSDSLSAAERQQSGPRYSVSDLAEKQVQAPLARKYSLGNDDLTATNQEEVVERALSGRAEALTINSAASSSSSTLPSTEFRSSSAINKSSQPGEIEELSNKDHPYRYPRVNSIPQNVYAGDSAPAEEKISLEISLSDSESDPVQRSPSVTSSPQFNQSNSRSPPPLPNHTTPRDPRSSGRGPEDAPNEQAHHEPRVLNRTLTRIFQGRRSRHGAHYRRRVVVNGVPKPDDLVKKAEEQAGPIHPGTYWYDVEAGFWGVAGGPCLGIIPPFIEEFNHPMTRDCAAGRTGISVNGRELHHMDKEKLCRRGLPDTPGMSYHVEINGRVVEEATNSELRSLGRLAPSLEKSGRGAGMYVPSNILGGRS